MSIGVEQPEAIPTLPEECQELYSPQEDSLEMSDDQLQKLLNATPKKGHRGDSGGHKGRIRSI